METIEIVRRRLVVPEPKELWTASLPEMKRTIIEAKALWAEYRSKFGFQIPTNLSELVFGSMPNSNSKLDKSEELIFGLALAQSNLSGINVCHWSSPECRKACVGQNGNNGFAKTMQAKIAKTRFLFDFPEEAGILLADFWMKAESKIELGYEVGGRSNTFSDIKVEEVMPWIFHRFPRINFYDYTKCWDRDVSHIPNYHLTYSVSEFTTDEKIIEFLSQGKNVAVVFNTWKGTPFPKTYLGYPVHNGDEDDVRWKDPRGSVIGLHRKGKLKATSPMCRAA